jgi:glycosyltransferase involved in cell wall biosynthesis
MRIAWFGPEPTVDSGVPYVATQILSSLPSAGASVDIYIAGAGAKVGHLEHVDGLRIIREKTWWEWDRWYSRSRLGAVVTGQAARLWAQRRLVRRLLESGVKYDLIYQFSQFESPWSRATARRLPPIVVHPEVHAAGELLWHRRERDLSRICEPARTRMTVRGILTARAALQRRTASTVDAFIAPSATFAQDIATDYGIDPSRVHVIPNPIDLGRFSPASHERDPKTALDLVYVSRIAVRKGVELVVGLSQRLDDLAGTVRIRVVGDGAMFSDYRPLLRGLNPAVAEYVGPRTATELATLYRTSSVLLQPSHYEPFALTVGEALASGVPVVASSTVGAAEGIDPRVCRVFAVGELDAFEAKVRDLVGELRDGGHGRLSTLARSEAERRFAPTRIADQLVTAFDDVCTPHGR